VPSRPEDPHLAFAFCCCAVALIGNLDFSHLAKLWIWVAAHPPVAFPIGG
jgi:hypothetical protein